MSVALRNVLISDAVDPACVELLQSHGINVTFKYKLPKDQLLQEIKVSPVNNYKIHISYL
jgi:D-3-phosphoglycerate dehydrogenase